MESTAQSEERSIMKIEFRLNEIVLEGYVNATDRDSRVLSHASGMFVERVEEGAFRRALQKNDDIKLTLNHIKVLGSTKTREVSLWEDKIGLMARATVTDPETIDRAKSGKLKGWSFAFGAAKDRWEATNKGYQRRYLEDIDLLEVAILDIQPAYIGTSIKMLPERLEIPNAKWNDKSVEMLLARAEAVRGNQLRLLRLEELRKTAGRTGKIQTGHELEREMIARLRAGGRF